MNNNSEQIGRYLQNEMNAEEKAAFEKQLTNDKDLQQELFIQKQIVKAVKTAALKNTFRKTIRRKLINQRLIQIGVGAIILVVAVFVFYAIKTNMFSNHNEGRIIDTENAERFVINNAADTIIETEEGVVFAIPAHAFNSKSDKVQLEIKTAISPYNIMKQGLSTTSNGSLLQTAGMFYINGYENEKPLSLVKNIDVSVPANEINPAMQLFDGVMDSSGRINWINPEPIEKRLRTYDITTLDFYPPNYIPVLKALQKDYTNKKYTDSLYFSFSGYGYPELDEIEPNISEAIPKDSTSKKVDTTNNRLSDVLMPLYRERHLHYEIDPSRIRAIWDTKFNYTILATKEFEERLHFLHQLCTAEYFQAYLEGMNKPLYEIDQWCADNSAGETRKTFLEFAARKDGGVMLKEGMQEKLSNYFQKKYKAYQEAAEKTFAKHQSELDSLSKIADRKGREQAARDIIREDKNFNEEFCMNLTDAYKQIGIKRTCNDTIPPQSLPKYYTVTIDTVGWKNLDVYVFDATANRESMSYTDPVTGKTATLTYKELKITIEARQQYERVLVYLNPDSLNSFQRIEQEGNTFKEKLNSLLHYDAVAIAFKDDKTYFYRQNNIQPGDHVFKLSLITEKELKNNLNIYSKQRSSDIKTEFEYQVFKQAELKRQSELRKEEDFRAKIAFAIFSCGEGRWYVRPPALGENVVAEGEDVRTGK